MAEHNINDSQEILDAIADMSFLPKEVKDENLGRDFPKISKNEGIFRLVYLALFAVAVVTFLVFLFVFGTKGYYFPSNIKGSYGVAGIVVTAIFVLVALLTESYGYCYDTHLSLVQDEKKKKIYKALNSSLFAVSFLFLYAMFFTTILRSFVFEQVFFGQSWFMQNFGWMFFILIALIAIASIVLSFLKPDVAKIYNYFLLAVSGWIVVCFSTLLSKRYSMSSNYGIMLLIFGAVFMNISLICLLFQKKAKGLRSAFQVLISSSLVFEALAVLIYGMVYLG